MMRDGPARGQEDRLRISLRDGGGEYSPVVDMDRADLLKMVGGFLILMLAVVFVVVVNPSASGLIWFFVGFDALLGFLILYAIQVRRAARGQ